ncbi:MAG TPA: hypothetical protein VEY70_06330 [Metabacillus sp.]|nr:hypothetical protein [Metabacillus sp.]
MAYDLEGLGAGARQGSSGTGEIPQALWPRKLTARTTESEHPGAEINYLYTYYFNNKVCTNSLLLIILEYGLLHDANIYTITNK